MDNWWIIILIAVVAVAAYVVYSRGQQRSVRDEAQRKLDASGTGDFTADRETSRLARMSEEDRAWEQASLSKNQVQEEQAGLPESPASAPVSERDGRPQA